MKMVFVAFYHKGTEEDVALQRQENYLTNTLRMEMGLCALGFHYVDNTGRAQ